MYRYLRPSMLQHLLRRLVFDVPILNEYAKMPLKVCYFAFLAGINPNYTDFIMNYTVFVIRIKSVKKTLM